MAAYSSRIRSTRRVVETMTGLPGIETRQFRRDVKYSAEMSADVFEKARGFRSAAFQYDRRDEARRSFAKNYCGQVAAGSRFTIVWGIVFGICGLRYGRPTDLWHE